MQEQHVQPDRQAERQATIQSTATGQIRGHRLNRIHLGLIVGLSVLAAGIFGFQALTSEQSISETQPLSPVVLAQEDPPLPEGWIDPYFTSRPAVIPVEQDPPLPAGWTDPYFDRPAVIPIQEDPPLPEGWVDPYFQRTD